MRACLVLLDPPATAVPFAPATASRRAVTASRRLTRPTKSPAILEREGERRGEEREKEREREGKREGKKIETTSGGVGKEREREEWGRGRWRRECSAKDVVKEVQKKLLKFTLRPRKRMGVPVARRQFITLPVGNALCPNKACTRG